MRRKWGLRFLLVLALILPAYNTVAHAQAAVLALLLGPKVASEDFYLSMKLGGNGAYLTGMDDTKPRYGLNFGITATIKVSEKFYIVPEFAPLSHKGVKDIRFRSTEIPSLDSLMEDPGTRVRELNYIDIPVVFKYQFNEQFSLGAGPQISILTGAEDVFGRNVVDENELSYRENIKSQLNTIDAGAVFELTYSMPQARKGKGLNVHARYALGLTDIMKDNPGDALRNSVFQFYLSFPFIYPEEG